jgi:kynurenine formamidase
VSVIESAGDVLEEYAARCSNWGRWGDADECGTANLITSQIVHQAARAVSLGRVVALNLPFDGNGPQTGDLGRFNCLRYSNFTGTDYALGKQRAGGVTLPREVGFADDVVSLPLQSATHWDALSHVFHRGKMYNGFPAEDVTSQGASRCATEALRGRLVGRAVLLDLPLAKGVPWLDDGFAITTDDLEEAAEHHRVEIREGDILMLRTGQMGRCLVQGWGTYAGGDAPGLSFSTLPQLHQSRVAAIATDTWGVEVRPNELPDSFQPFHIVAVVYMGLLLGEMFLLEELAEVCAEADRHDFLLSASPLPFTSSAGGPPGAVAIV